jgi:hypothetical protein
MADQALSDEARVTGIVTFFGGGEAVRTYAPLAWRTFAALAGQPYQRELQTRIAVIRFLLVKLDEEPGTPVAVDLAARMQERGINLRALLQSYQTELNRIAGQGGDGTSANLRPLSGQIAATTPAPSLPGAPDPWDLGSSRYPTDRTWQGGRRW